MILQNEAAILEIVNINAIRDGTILRVALDMEPTAWFASVIIVPRPRCRAQFLTLRFSGVILFDMNLGPSLGSTDISRLKLRKLPDSFYLSLDPYDEFSQVRDERDALVIEATTFEAELQLREPA